jgi:uncharacterized protein YrzB (UPF0473 family)
MNSDESKMIIKDESGIEKEYYKLFTFDSEETKKSYIVYTDYTKDDNGNIIVKANTYDPTGTSLELKPLTDEKEWKVIEGILETTQTELKNITHSQKSGEDNES